MNEISDLAIFTFSPPVKNADECDRDGVEEVAR